MVLPAFAFSFTHNGLKDPALIRILELRHGLTLAMEGEKLLHKAKHHLLSVYTRVTIPHQLPSNELFPPCQLRSLNLSNCWTNFVNVPGGSKLYGRCTLASHICYVP